MKKKVPVIVIALLAVGTAAAWLVTRPGLPQSVITAAPQSGKAVEAVYATAVVEPVTWAAIAPVRTGRIVEINFDEGAEVKKGDVLARLDDADLRAELKEEEALAEYHKENLARAEKLVNSSTIARKDYDLRKADYAQSAARIAKLEEQIRQFALIAPMDGTVLWRDVELGEVKEAGKSLFWVGLPHPLRLEAEVDEEDIPKIAIGQKSLITADAFPGKVMEGAIAAISPKGDPVNKSYRVYIGLPEDTKLMIGMTVETNTITEEKDGALLIPAEALIEDSYVWRAVRETGIAKASRTPVKTGIRGKEQVEITEGLSLEDRVIMPPFGILSDGKPVQIK